MHRAPDAVCNAIGSSELYSCPDNGVIRVSDEAGNVIETTRRLLLSSLRGNQLAVRGRECQNDRVLVVAMCAQFVCVLFRA